MVNCCGGFNLRRELTRSSFTIEEDDKFITIQIFNRTFHFLELDKYIIKCQESEYE